MMAPSLFFVLAAAHLLMLAGRTVATSPWTPIAYLWHDVVVALMFALFEMLASRKWIVRTVYVAIVVYAALNVPVAHTLSSPLTRTMIGAAGGPLRDSIVHYFTAAKMAPVAVILLAGILLPRISGIRRLSESRLAVAALLTIAVLGPLASSRVETQGLDRNAITSLLSSGSAAISPPDGWSLKPFHSEARMSTISRFKGAAAGRNVLLVILESTGARYLKPYGAAADPMPNLSRLSESAIVFERAYAVYPESIKGLLAVLCSQYPEFGVSAETYADVPCASLPQALGSAGYRTALFHSGRFMYLGMEAIIENRGFETLEDAGQIGGEMDSSFGIDERAAVNRILSWIDSEPEGTPFFVTYLPVAGHHPYAAPVAGPFAGDTEFGRYQNALHYGDASLGALLQGLRDRDLENNMLIVIFGDHGEAFGQHEANMGHALFIYDENVHVPYLIAAPGLIEERTTVADTVSVIDTAPSILELLGIEAPADFQGRPLFSASERMAYFFTDYAAGWVGLADSCWKLIFQTDSKRSRLYNVCTDPGETVDRSEDEPERLRYYLHHLNPRPEGEGAVTAEGWRGG